MLNLSSVIHLTCIMSALQVIFFSPELVVIMYLVNVAVLLLPTSVSAEKQEKICIAFPFLYLTSPFLTVNDDDFVNMHPLFFLLRMYIT